MQTFFAHSFTQQHHAKTVPNEVDAVFILSEYLALVLVILQNIARMDHYKKVMVRQLLETHAKRNY